MFATGAPAGGPQLKTKKALLLIDLQNDFVDSAGKLYVSNTADFLPKLPHLIQQFRSQGDIFFINTAYAEPQSIYSEATGGYGLVLKSNVTSRQPSVLADDGEDGSHQRRMSTAPAEASHITTGGVLNKDVEAFLTPPYNSQASWSQCCTPQSTGASMPDILSSAVDASVDTEIIKSHYSPFQDASFLLHLRMQLITELYVCGSLSNISVYATVLDAVSHGMSITIVEDCVGYRDERCHREAMRQMADSMGANGIDYQELLDDLGGLLGDVVHEEAFETRYDVTFQRVLQQNKAKPDPKQKASAWLSSLEESTSEGPDAAESSSIGSMLEGNPPTVELARSRRQGTEPLSDFGPRRQQTPESPPRKRLFDDHEPDERDPKVYTRRRASHEGHTGDISLVKSKPARRRKPLCQDRHRSPTPQQEARPHVESKSTGDIPRAVGIEPMIDISDSKITLHQSTSQDTTARAKSASSETKEKILKKPTKLKKPMPSEKVGPGDTIAADSHILWDVLPEQTARTIFSDLHNEITWQKMYHRSGEVPRLVAVQGESTPTQVPIYRHPADASPPLLPLTPTVQLIRKAAESAAGHPLNHVLIQLYRGPEDNISEHADKTLDIVRGTRIVNYSAGALRTMVLRSKKATMSTLDVDVQQGSAATDTMSPGPPRAAIRVPLPHNSLFVLGPETNRGHLHAIRPDRRMRESRSAEEEAEGGQRISLTFRNVGTFVDPTANVIWGQGARRKTRDSARGILLEGDVEREVLEAEHERMIRAFGQENHRSESWVWEEHYGAGFDVVDGRSARDGEGNVHGQRQGSSGKAPASMFAG